MKYRGNTFHFCITLVATILALVGTVFGQTAEEHAKHHPARTTTVNTASDSTNPALAPSAMGSSQPEAAQSGGMGAAGMGEMMKQMGTPPRKELYPWLMALPDEVAPEERAGIEQLAHERMKEGTALLSSGLKKLSDSTSDENYAAMQQATEQMRDGLAELEVGIAALRVLSEGKAPRNLALDWFKREMNLALPIHTEEPHALLGVTPFHFFTMVLLIVFALAMVAMYFFKMRRAAAPFGRLDSNKKPPPPGASPPLAGTPGPVAPLDRETPPPSATPPDEKSPSPDPPRRGTPPPTAPDGGDAAKIAGRAGELWQARGRPMGSPEIDWLRAEKELAKAADKPPTLPPAEGSSDSPATPQAVSEATPASPVTANWRGQLRVGSIVTETPSVKTFRLLPSSNDRFLPFTFVPGQFLNVAFWIGGARMNRSYSISSSPTQREYVELTVRREPRGAVSRHIDDLLKVGDQIEAGGPVGRFTFTGTEADSIVLIAGGVGITPMMSITRYLTERSWAGDIFFIYACRTPADFIFADKVAALQRVNPKLRVAVTMSRPEGTDWKGPRGRITKEWLTQTVPNLASRRIHMCGPPVMMNSTKDILTELGVPPDSLKTESFGTTKPTPAAPGTTAKPTATATGPLVTFSKNNKSAKIHVDETVLELSEKLAIGIEFSCRVGTCGVCKVKMTSGEVAMAVEDALEPDDKVNGTILACQAKPNGDVVVEA